jgi:hypothetical protein
MIARIFTLAWMAAEGEKAPTNLIMSFAKYIALRSETGKRIA